MKHLAVSELVQKSKGIELPVVFQALRDEIRALDGRMREGRLTQLEAEARLDAWDLKYPPGWHRFEKFAVLGVWEEEEPPAPKREYRTPQATVDAFFGWIVRQDEPTQARWLAEHPKDAGYLKKLWEEKCKAQSK